MANKQRCPRCTGNLFDGHDIYSEYQHCLQCGFSREVSDEGSLDRILAHVLRNEGKHLTLPTARKLRVPAVVAAR